MSKYQDKKKRIFKKYSANLQILVDEPSRRMRFFNPESSQPLTGDFYACPICLNCFEVTAIDEKILTGEDVPPKSAGGRVNVLTCKTCNNQAGSNLDLHISKSLDLDDFFRNKNPISSTISFLGNNKFKGSVKLDMDEKVFHFIIPSNQYTSNQLDLLKKNWNGGKIDFSFQGPNNAKLEKAIARMAYLKMFEIFGYSYVFSKGGWILRNFILEKETEFKLICTIENTFQKEDGIYLVTKPDDARSFMVCLNLKRNGTIKSYFVFVPGPTQEAIERYMNFPKTPKTFWFRDVNMKADFLQSHVSIDVMWNKLLKISAGMI